MGRCNGNANRMGTDVVMRYMVNENEMVMSRDAVSTTKKLDEQ